LSNTEGHRAMDISDFAADYLVVESCKFFAAQQ
jgi:hypothetical protein